MILFSLKYFVLIFIIHVGMGHAFYRMSLFHTQSLAILTCNLARRDYDAPQLIDFVEAFEFHFNSSGRAKEN